MILTPYTPSDAFSLIVWLLINQSRHIRYQMKAEYLSYGIVYTVIDARFEKIITKEATHFEILQ